MLYPPKHTLWLCSVHTAVWSQRDSDHTGVTFHGARLWILSATLRDLWLFLLPFAWLYLDRDFRQQFGDHSSRAASRAQGNTGWYSAESLCDQEAVGWVTKLWGTVMNNFPFMAFLWGPAAFWWTCSEMIYSVVWIGSWLKSNARC